ncbi:protein HOTHEAD [Sesamum angolense]|uniref:Protein HOTHEAD n=1 Tax=Sesamum angolense TaxID=2727404 RepID=A0AAE1W1J3_9LAMI|nr:protein HOTHEAD [Sesamum angolense]
MMMMMMMGFPRWSCSWSSLLAAASLGIFSFFIVSSFAEKAPYKSFAKDARTAPSSGFYDYIIVGGGTAGCPLAATLSVSAKVLLLERGGLPYDNPNVTHIDGFPATLSDTSSTSAAQLFVSTDGVFNHRARVLGGGSAINAGFYTRASSEYVKEMGWEPRLVEESYAWVERKVAFRPVVKAWQAAVRDGLLEAGVSPYRGTTYAHLHGTKIGGSIFDENGYRHTAADLLEYADPANITVYLHAVVHQILIKTSPGQKPKAYGVFFRDSKGGRHVAYLNNGPRVLVPSPRPVELSLIEVVGITDVGSYVEAASGSLDLAWLRRTVQDFAKAVNQTLQTFTIPINLTIPEATGIPELYQNPGVQAGVILEKIMGPFSTGFLELQSRDPNDNPRVTFNYFQDPRDLQRCVQGMEIIKRVVESRPFSPFRYPFTSFQSLMNMMLAVPNNLRIKHFTAAYSMEQFCLDTVMTIWHYHGGCQVDRVVDHDYRVLGMDALRVIDGSTFYSSPGTNPQATVMMLGRYMGQNILQERNAR